MTITNLTITSRASASYQVGEVSITISDITSQDDITKAKNLVVNKSIEVLNDIIEKTGATKEPAKVEVRESKPVQQPQQYNSYKRQEKPATEAQINWLINNGEFTKERSLMSSKELGLLIADLKAKHYQQY